MGSSQSTPTQVPVSIPAAAPAPTTKSHQTITVVLPTATTLPTTIPTIASDGSPPPPEPAGAQQFLKGFVTGALLASLNKRLLLGAAIGTLAGAFYQQEFGAPNVKEQWEVCKAKAKEFAEQNRKWNEEWMFILCYWLLCQVIVLYLLGVRLQVQLCMISLDCYCQCMYSIN